MTRDELIQSVAKDTHNQWTFRMKEKGWSYGVWYDEDKKIHPNLRDFEKLTPPDQEYPLLTATAAVDLFLARGYIEDIKGMIPEEHSRTDLVWLIHRLKDLLVDLVPSITSLDSAVTRERFQEIIAEAERAISREAAINPRGA